MESAKKYVNEWLQARVDQSLSAWTIQTEAKALGKIYGIQPDDEDYFIPPKRNRGDIKRSRGDRVRDSHFSEANNDELIKFCQGTGLRRSELTALKGKDLIARAQIEDEVARMERIPLGRRKSRIVATTLLFSSEVLADNIGLSRPRRHRWRPFAER